MKNLKALLSTLVVIGIIYVAYRIVPVYLTNYQFQEEIQTISRTAAFGTAIDETRVRQQVADKISSEQIPLRPEDVSISMGSQDVMIWATYKVHVDLPIHPIDLTFTAAARNGEKLENPPPRQQQ